MNDLQKALLTMIAAFYRVEESEITPQLKIGPGAAEQIATQFAVRYRKTLRFYRDDCTAGYLLDQLK